MSKHLRPKQLIDALKKSVEDKVIEVPDGGAPFYGEIIIKVENGRIKFYHVNEKVKA